MRRVILFIFISVAALSFVTRDTVAAPKKPTRSQSQTFATLADEILKALQSFYPVKATEMGIHTYDHRFADYSTRSVKGMISRLKQFESRLGKLKNIGFEPEDMVNYKLIKSNVDVALLELEKIAWYKKSPLLYAEETVNGLYYLALSSHDSPAGKLPAILGRMRQVEPLLATARAEIQTPPKVFVDAAKTTLETGAEFYRSVASDLMQLFPARADSILSIATAAREAMHSFIEYLDSIPVGDEKSFAIGKENFNYLLANEHFFAFSADSLEKLGESLLEEASKAYGSFEATVEKNHQPGQDSVFVPSTFTRSDILDYYQWEVDQVRKYLEMNHVLTVPDDIGPVRVVETPPMLRTLISSIAYQPAGPFDQQQVGYFYVRPLPDSMDQAQLDARYRFVHRRGFKGSVVHEAFPGHHLQMQLAGRNSNPIRKWQRNNLMIEGWALYSEEMMYKFGLFGTENPAQWLAILGGIRFRAARIVADVKLHTGQWSFDECVDWMIRTLNLNTESEEEFVRKEVLRYTSTPTVQMSYLMGKREIERLRDLMQFREGYNFSEQVFYDKLLSAGSIPPSLVWELWQLNTAEQQTSNN